MKKILSIAAISLCFFSACKLSSETVPPPALARFVHACPDAGNIDVLLNGGLLAENFAFTKDTAVAVSPGITNFMVLKTGSGSSLINTNFTLNAQKAYTIFAIDSSKNIKTSITTDVFTLPPSDSVMVRFFHFSPNTPAIHAIFNYLGADSIKFYNRSFNDQQTNTTPQAFAKFKAGTYDIDILLADTNEPIRTISLVQLTGGNVYTFYLKGNDGGVAEQALGIGTVWHNR